MSTFGQLRKLFLNAVEDRKRAEQEVWEHLTEGYRRVCSRLELPELQRVSTVALADGDETFDWDCDALAIRMMHNDSDGIPMYEEPGKMAGRMRYLEDTTGQPPKGTPEKWVRSGDKVYVRDRADGAKTLRILWELRPPDIAAANIADHPITPAEYDRSIVLAATYSFYTTYPSLNKAEEGQPLPSQVAKQALDESFAEQKNPMEIEERAQRQTTRIAGFRYSSPRRGR